jgi:hypothetical protein
MTVAAMETNLVDVRKGEMTIRTVDKGDNKKRKLCRMSKYASHLYLLFLPVYQKQQTALHKISFK